jgi:UDP:flavonoid glycosyltransferase YjiC (YdhE family)
VPKPPSLLGSLPNRPSYQIARQMMWQAFRSADKAARREVLDLPAAPFFGPFNAEPVRGQPILYGYSPAVITPPADWGADVHVTGYWFLDPADDWSPDPALADFLAAGPSPVYVGFGSMSSRNPEATANLILDALARTGQRGIIHAGWGGLQRADLPGSVLMIEGAPFSWLFPRVAAVVHHGGAGTTSAGLRAGVPSVVVPFFGDQPFWGQRVADLGVGPAPIPRKKLTAERLAGAIRIAVTDEVMRGRAVELGAKIRAEDGIARAVAVVEQMRR